MGRPPLLSREGITALREKAIANDLKLQSYTRKTFKAAFLEAMQGEAAAAGADPLSVQMPNAKTVDKYMKMIVPERVSHPSTQNERRNEVHSSCAQLTMKVMQDPRNQASLAAMLGAIGMEREDGFTKEMTFNVDVSTLWLDEPEEAAFVSEGVQAVLKELRRSVTITKKGHQRRSISIMAMISAAGHLNCAIVIIKDSSFARLDIHQVRHAKNK
jgi:hypothetical protein